MPGFDGSGPRGDGPMGRGFGPCRGNRADYRAGGGIGRRGWFGRSWFGRGWAGGGRFFQTYTPQDEIADLEQEKTFLEKRLEELKQLRNRKEEQN